MGGDIRVTSTVGTGSTFKVKILLSEVTNQQLRADGHHQARILMISASALEAHGTPLAQPFHDGYLMKPIDIPRLLETIRQLLKLEWQYGPDEIILSAWRPDSGSRPPVGHIEELIGLGQIG